MWCTTADFTKLLTALNYSDSKKSHEKFAATDAVIKKGLLYGIRSANMFLQSSSFRCKLFKVFRTSNDLSPKLKTFY